MTDSGFPDMALQGFRKKEPASVFPFAFPVKIQAEQPSWPFLWLGCLDVGQTPSFLEFGAVERAPGSSARFHVCFFPFSPPPVESVPTLLPFPYQAPPVPPFD